MIALDTRMSDRSLVRVHGSGHSRLLACFHHAGAGASSFAGWPVRTEIDADLAFVQLKGREDRCAERLDDTLPALAYQIADELLRAGHRDLVLLGHSMGGTIAWWVASALWQYHGRRCRLVISAQAPEMPAEIQSWHPSDLRAWYAKLGEPWPAVLDHPEMRELLTSTLGCDIAWMQQEFRRGLPGPLPLEVHGLCWESDPLVRSQDMMGWQYLTTGPFSLHTLQGGHLELCARPEPALALLRRLLNEEPGYAP